MDRVLLVDLVAIPLVLGILLPGHRAAWAQGVMSSIKSDERVVFFPTEARLSDDRQTWIVPIHGWIFEPEENDALRTAAVRELREVLGLSEKQPATAIFEKRLRAFLVDNERGKRVGIEIADRRHVLPSSARDGHFIGTVQLPAAIVDEPLAAGRLRYSAILSRDDPREFQGVTFCPPSVGISVISDIDDTIKITDVRDKKELIENTFFREFRAVEGMAAVYRRWADAGAQFHFVSSSPWQLYEPLAAFTRDAGFPDAVFHLKRFRLKDSNVLRLLDDPLGYKLSEIEPLIRSFPQRKFILVGDSGEKDPEVYGVVARRYAEQVVRIYIRDVTDEPANAPRYQDAFRDVPSEKWRLFHDPATLSWPVEPPTR
jgi:phosphatidate phosphatase APP1